MQKRGLSTVITTLIIILISLVAVGIVWVVVRNIIQTGTEGVSLSPFSVSARIMDVSTDNNSNNISLTVKRNVGKGDLSGISFVFSSNTDTEVITRNVSLDEMQQMRFNFHLTNISVSNLISVSIFPLIEQDGNQVLGIILDKYNLGNNQNNAQTPTCVPVSNPCGTFTCGNVENGTCGPVSCGTCVQSGYSCVGGSCQLTNSLCSNLILLMHFDNNSAVGENDTFVYDGSHNGNNGIVVNNSRMNLTGGKYGGSFYFENKNDFIYSPTFSSTANMTGTISFWLYYKSYRYADGFVVFDPYALAATEGVVGGGRLRYERTSWYYLGFPTTGADIISNSNIPLNQWTLYTLTWNQTSARIYLNGALDAEDTTITLPYTSLKSFYIGSDRGIVNRSMNGSIDDLAIWNRTLNDSEISNIYNSGTAINC